MSPQLLQLLQRDERAMRRIVRSARTVYRDTAVYPRDYFRAVERIRHGIPAASRHA